MVLRDTSSWETLRQGLRNRVQADMAVVDPYHGRGTADGPAPELRLLLRELSSAAVLVAVGLKSSQPRDLRTLGAWGVTDVIVTDQDDAGAIARLLRSARGRPLQTLLERSLPSAVSSRGRSILGAAADVVATGGQGERLARSLYVSMRTLNRWCEGEGLPPPRQTLAWLRILWAAEMLDDPARSVEAVALACGYASDSGLRRAFDDFLGVSPTAVRKQGAFATASRAFQRALEAPAEPRVGRTMAQPVAG